MSKKEGSRIEQVPIEKLRPHPKNYRQHPDDQLDHIVASIKANGIYRNIVCANDYTVLAGHGVMKACQKMGMKEVPVIRLDVGPDDVRAMKVVTGDNEISHLGVIDDRLLSEILKDIKDRDEVGLLGTGYNDETLNDLLATITTHQAPKEFPSVDENVATDFQCPKCAFKWSGKKS